MKNEYHPFGPYYLTLIYESGASKTAPAVETAYVDGFEDEAAAWAACGAIGPEAVNALDKSGVEITLSNENILQVTIARSETADFPHALAS